MQGPPSTARRALHVRRILAVLVAGWLAFASVRAADRAFERWPEGSHERGWTTSLAERERISLGPILPLLEALETHTDPGAIVLAPARADSTALIDVPVNGIIGWARFLALPRMVVVTEPDQWRARIDQVAATDELWVLDMIGATTGDRAGLVETATGPGFVLFEVERGSEER
ncbi:hypothetical protein Pla163_06580 [Planctomycetes bacterium Pla163]|uniref:Uncharacterized protein n=1 Tax=Rohdeia mirabilis TaxID=2528008 RepID=A0A518CWG5_9BACT|nr:hypothetical protein Pla163_06580 [Planctomycetes bacterium Pla163]